MTDTYITITSGANGFLVSQRKLNHSKVEREHKSSNMKNAFKTAWQWSVETGFIINGIKGMDTIKIICHPSDYSNQNVWCLNRYNRWWSAISDIHARNEACMLYDTEGVNIVVNDKTKGKI